MLPDMATMRKKAIDQALCALLFLASIYEVASAPEVERPAYRPNFLDHKLDKVVRHSLDNQLNEEDTFPESLSLHDQPISSYHGMHIVKEVNSVDKKDARLHTRSSSRLRTLLRIEAPCAGGNEHFTFGAAPTAASVSISPRDLLVTLGNEAVDAEKLALHILHRLEEMGVNHQVALVLGRASNVGFHLRNNGALSSGEVQVSVVLSDIYKQLARTALVLEEIVEEDDASFSPLIDNLKENGIYSLLCGVKVVLDSKDAAFRQNGVAILGNTRLMDAPNSAFRLARNYDIIREVARLLAEIGTSLTLTAQYL